MGGLGGANVPTRGKQRVCMAFLGVFDSILSIFLFAPLVVGYWRGCWQLMDIFLFPNDKQLSVMVSLAIGIISGLVFCLLQGPLTTLCDNDKRPRLHLLVSRLYTCVYCVCSVSHWRGVWSAWDLYTGISWQSGATSTGIGLLTLALTRGLKNILAPPFIVVPDHPSDYFKVPTLFSAKQERCGYFLVDSVFTVVVTGSLVVFVWRGTWVFLDALLFPQQPLYSAWGSMVLGMTVTLLVFAAQMVMIPCLRRIRKGLGKILLEDAYHTICFVGDVNMWRGVWNLLNIYLLSDVPVVSNLVTSIGGLVVLMCLYTSNSILVRGAVMDGADEGSKGVVFPTKYLRFFYKRKLAEERQRPDFWVRGGEGVRQPLHISAPIESTIASKINGMCDGRGYGDGHSFTDGYGDGFTSGYADEERTALRPNSTFLGSDAAGSSSSGVRISIVRASSQEQRAAEPRRHSDTQPIEQHTQQSETSL